MSTKPSSEETPDLQGAFPRLSDAQIAALDAQGQRRPIQPGEVLFAEGDRDFGFFVVLAGRVASVEAHGTPEERVIAVHGTGRFLGELSLLTGEGAWYSAVALDAGEVLAVPVARLRDLVARDPAFGDLVLRAYLVRGWVVVGLGVGLRIVGSQYSPDTRRLRDFAARNRLPYRWLDLEADPSAEAVAPISAWRRRHPARDRARAAAPQPRQRRAGRRDRAPGAGRPAHQLRPARGRVGAVRPVRRRVRGLGRHAGRRPGRHRRRGPARDLVADQNYLGFPSGISGAELAERALLQAQKFGARFAVPAEATSIEHDDGHYRVRLSNGTSLASALVVLATGVRYRRLDVPRADYFEKMSIYYAASQAEALVCAGDPVAIVGGGNSAGQAAVFLSAHATEVTLIVREGDLGEHMSRYLIDQVRGSRTCTS